MSSCCLILFALFRWLPMSLLLLAGIGIGSIMIMDLANALVQMMTPERLRGRVMGAYTWVFFGTMPLGALWAGSMADRIGLSEIIVVNGALALILAAAIWLLFPKLREQ